METEALFSLFSICYVCEAEVVCERRQSTSRLHYKHRVHAK